MPNRIAQVEIIIFKIEENKPLFLLLKRNSKKGGFWQPVTGGADPGEEFNTAARREVFEETKIENIKRLIEDVHFFEFIAEGYGTTKEYVFGAEVEVDIKVEISDEHTEYRWCSFDEALELLKYETNKEAFRKLLEKMK